MPRPAKRKPIAALATIGVTLLVVIAAVLLGRSDPSAETENGTASTPAQPPGPAGRVQTMLIAAQEGDVETYLACFAGELREALNRQAAEASRAAFADRLRQEEADLENLVTKDVKQPAEDEATLELVRSYTDRNLRHRVRLKRIGGEWKITDLVPVEQYKPEIPYGTPVVPGLEGQPEK